MRLAVPHHQQRNGADCLAACAAMLLQYHGLSADYQQLLSLLEIGPIGAPRRNISRLAQLGIQVEYREATIHLLLDWLHAGIPCIAFVDTEELSYWDVTSNHALVVVGFETEVLLVNDPALKFAPQRILIDEFELAWLNNDYMCAYFVVPD